MAFNVPYSNDTVRIPDAMVAGNSTADNPVEYDIVPAWGADLARLKSIMFASIHLADNSPNWAPDVQEAVIKACETGARAFANTVTKVRGLTVPVSMALRAGLISDEQASQLVVGSVPITTGEQFTRIAGALAGHAFYVAMKIIELSGKQEVDPRFFEPASGSGGQGTSKKQTSTARSARRGSRSKGTAGSPAQTATPPAGTSPAS